MQADLDSVTRIVSALVRGMKNNGTILRYDSPDDYATVVGDRGVSDARGIAAEVAAAMGRRTRSSRLTTASARPRRSSTPRCPCSTPTMSCAAPPAATTRAV